MARLSGYFDGFYASVVKIPPRRPVKNRPVKSFKREQLRRQYKELFGMKPAAFVSSQHMRARINTSLRVAPKA